MANCAVVNVRGMQRAVTLITFDVDGTLIQGSSLAAQVSVHAKAFMNAVGLTFGGLSDWERTQPSPPKVIPPSWYHGSTDGLIALQLAKHGFGVDVATSHSKLPAVFDQMFKYVKERTDQEVAEGIDVLPGVQTQLEKLAKRRVDSKDVLVGLVTGNVEGIARKKMRAVGLFKLDVFSPAAKEQKVWAGEEDTALLGGFGSDFCTPTSDDHSRLSKDRGEQILIAVRRAQSLLSSDEKLVRVVHVGDAPADVLAARYCCDTLKAQGIAVGMVACATGKFSVLQLLDVMGPVSPAESQSWVVLERGVGSEDFLSHCGLAP